MKKTIGYIIVIPIIVLAIGANIIISIQDPRYLLGISIGLSVLVLFFLGMYLITKSTSSILPEYKNPPEAPEVEDKVSDRDKILEFLNWLSNEPDFNIGKDDIIEIIQDYEFYQMNECSDYELDEEGNKLSCCGDILDEDIMICPTCLEHN